MAVDTLGDRLPTASTARRPLPAALTRHRCRCERQGARTLVHGDPHLGNLFVDAPTGPHRLPRLGGDRPLARASATSRTCCATPYPTEVRRTPTSDGLVARYCELLAQSRHRRSTSTTRGSSTGCSPSTRGSRRRRPPAWARSGSRCTSGSAAPNARHARVRRPRRASICWRRRLGYRSPYGASGRVRSPKGAAHVGVRRSAQRRSTATPGVLAGQKGKVTLLVNVASLLRPHAAVRRVSRSCTRSTATRASRSSASRATSSARRSRARPRRSRRSAARTTTCTFPLTEKIEVNGDNRHPLYQQLTHDGRRAKATPATSAGTSRSSSSDATARSSPASRRWSSPRATRSSSAIEKAAGRVERRASASHASARGTTGQ